MEESAISMALLIPVKEVHLWDVMLALNGEKWYNTLCLQWKPFQAAAEWLGLDFQRFFRIRIG